MSWSVTKSSTDKAELQETVDNEPNCPQSVRDAVKAILAALPDGKEAKLDSYGHHYNGELANATISIMVGG